MKEQLCKEYEKTCFKLYMIMRTIGYIKDYLIYQERINNEEYNMLYKKADRLVGRQLTIEDKL